MDKKSLMFMGNEWTLRKGKAQEAFGLREYMRLNYALVIRSPATTAGPLYLASIGPKKKCGCSYKSYAAGHGKSEKSALADLERTINGFRAVTDPPAPTEEQVECPYCKHEEHDPGRCPAPLATYGKCKCGQ